jgi:hypothetical protein
MSATKILWGQVTIVFAIVLIAVWQPRNGGLGDWASSRNSTVLGSSSGRAFRLCPTSLLLVVSVAILPGQQ